jgi:hypothetical protein
VREEDLLTEDYDDEEDVVVHKRADQKRKQCVDSFWVFRFI